MRFQGRITEWKEDRGFGFITPDHDSARVFVHIKAFPRMSRRPQLQDRVTYALGTDPRGRIRAANVEFLMPGRDSDRRRVANPALLFVAFSFAAFVVGLMALDVLPWIVGVTYVVASCLSFGTYALDKEAARKVRRRTSERTLHLLDLLGGWPGGLAAQQILRHL